MFVVIVTKSHLGLEGEIKGAELVATAFSSCNNLLHFPFLEVIFKYIFTYYVAFIFVPVLGLNVMIGYSQHGIKNMCFIFGEREIVKNIFTFFYLLSGFLGGIFSLGIVLSLLDFTISLLIIINVSCILLYYVKEIRNDLKLYKIKNENA